MFTGIVQHLGLVTAFELRGEDARLVVDIGDWTVGDLETGDSIAVNGACLTIVERLEHGFAADVSLETLRLTTLGGLRPGAAVNLEKPLTLATPLGGHLMLGHIDGIGRIEAMANEARSRRLSLRVPQALARYVAPKGSIGVDGVSLTVNTVDDASFTINIIPHTLERTAIKHYTAGAAVNIEVDMMARYLERLMQNDGKE
jgi:riboflavin synthase